jgi:hypothetical protein
MKWAIFFCAASVAALPFQAAHAAQGDEDIVILSVKPRSADVKPIAVAVSSKGQDIGKSQNAQAGLQAGRR